MLIGEPAVGIGACLVGQPVRYNGESKRKNAYIESLKNHLNLSAFCPEMAIGMGVPREPIRLVGELGNLRLLDSDTQTEDFTDLMTSYAATVLKNNPDMAGYILVKGSPSCGYERVKRYNEKGNPLKSDAMGIFAAELRKQDPLLPLEEDGRLNDHCLRENFISRVFAYHDWKQLVSSGITHKALIQFWVRYKYQVMAHHIDSYKSIGRLLANHNGLSVDHMADNFIHLLMNALNTMATRKSHSNVLEHIRGYLKKHLGGEDKKELSDLIEQYRNEIVPLIVPLTMLRHHFKVHKNSYIDQQNYLSPYPEELSLRNHL